mgnify:CR=1 FL=1
MSRNENGRLEPSPKCLCGRIVVSVAELLSEYISGGDKVLPFRRDTVIENYHGTKVADPFRYLEDPNCKDTIGFIEAANKVSTGYLNSLEQRAAIKKRLTELYDYPKQGLPMRADDRYFFFRNDGLQNQPLLYLQEGLAGEPGTVDEADAVNYSRVYLHRLGTEQSADKLIYERPDFKQLGFHASITHDDTYLCLHVFLGTNPENRFYYRELKSDGPFVRLLDDNDAMYRLIGNDGPLFYFHTDSNAPRGRVIAIDVTNPERANWRELIPEQEAVMDSVSLFGDHLVVAYTKHACAQLKLYTLQGQFVREIELPGVGSLEGLSGRREYNDFYFGFTSYLYPSSSFCYDIDSDKVTPFFQPQVAFDSSQFETVQVFYQSKDGTRVPMFLTYKKGLQLDGNNPTLLYGYGGYNISMTPAFSPNNLVWIEKGGIYAVACLRGGSEYGEEWHRAGMLESKQNVFDDFIAAAEWLIANNYTSTPKLGIMGRSNGGLLVGSCITQRPELYGAAICWVGVLDMLRYHLFSAGRYWTGEYGNAIENADHFRFMYRYSPIHNVKFATVYPPTLIRTAETDDRVVPMNSLKFYAALQSAAGNPEDIYLFVERKAGHGVGKPIAKQIDEQADIWSFLCSKLGVN